MDSSLWAAGAVDPGPEAAPASEVQHSDREIGKIAMPPPSPSDDHVWLDVIEKDSCFMPLDLTNSRPSKSLDFGNDGFTGSLSTWHELLQITAPNRECGLVFVRGDFPDDPDAIFARAQRSNYDVQFGLRIMPPQYADWMYELTPVQGMVNVRWPCTRFNWVRKHESLGYQQFATCTMCSFIRDGALFQIARIVPSKLPGIEVSASVVNVSEDFGGHPSETKFTVTLGGDIRFGCPSISSKSMDNDCEHISTDRKKPPMARDKYTCTPEPGESSYVASCSGVAHQKRLEMRLWINGNPVKASLHENALRFPYEPRGFADQICYFKIKKNACLSSQPLVIISKLAIVDAKLPIDDFPTPQIPPGAVSHHLGTLYLSSSGTYRLWSAMLRSSSSDSDPFELNAVSRSVEAILSVSPLPVHDIQPSSVSSRGDDDSEGNRSNANYTALLGNIISPQSLNLESVLWQVRLLVLVASLLSNDTALSEAADRTAALFSVAIAVAERDNYNEMRLSYRAKIVEKVRDICRWVLQVSRAMAVPHHPEEPKTRIFPFHDHWRHADQGPSYTSHLKSPGNIPRSNRRWLLTSAFQRQKYYCSIIIWYVLRHLPEVFGPTSSAFDELRNNFLYMGVTRPEEDLDHPFDGIVQWYYDISFANICNVVESYAQGRVNQSREERRKEFLRTISKADNGFDHIQWGFAIGVDEQRSEERFSRLRSANLLNRLLQRRIDGNILVHEVACIASLAPELGSSESVTADGKSFLDLAKDLIRRRDPTTQLSPCGYRLETAGSSDPSSAPWELYCLAHFAPCLVGIADTKEWAVVRDTCKEFMFSDYSFMASWDPADSKTIGKWWDLRTSSIVSAKLLEHRMHDGPSLADIADRLISPGETPPVSLLELEKVELLRKIYAAQSLNNAGSRGIFDWKKRKPRKLYHYNGAVCSQDSQQILGWLLLRRTANLERHISGRGIDDTRHGLETAECAAGIHCLSCMDFKLTTNRSGQSVVDQPNLRGLADRSMLRRWATVNDEPRLARLLRLLERSSLIDLYLLGHPEKSPLFKQYSEVLSNTADRGWFLNRYRAELLRTLNTSLVDLGVRYRIIFARRLFRATLRDMVLHWHPDALTSLDDHLGAMSSFINTNAPRFTGHEEVWTSSVTIKLWRLMCRSDSDLYNIESTTETNEQHESKRSRRYTWLPAAVNPLRRSERGRARKLDIEDDSNLYWDDESFPPAGVKDSRPFRKDVTGVNQRIRELNVTLVITGDEEGRNWICSVICELFDVSDINGFSLEVTRILQLFIHQQATGRCLVFLLLLGHMCEKLAEEGEAFMLELNSMGSPVVGISSIARWKNTNKVLEGFRRMIWKLESFRSYSSRLDQAVDTVRIAGDVMKKSISQEAGVRDRDMTAAADDIQETFSKNLGQLLNLNIALQKDVDQGYKQRDSIASILNTEQNVNVGALTWLTILYLGPSFIAGLYSTNHQIIPDSDGPDSFYRLAIYLLIGTVLVAVCLRYILTVAEFLKRIIQRVLSGIWDGIWDLIQWVSFKLMGVVKECWHTFYAQRHRKRAARRDAEA